jgi:hypothetical protein
LFSRCCCDFIFLAVRVLVSDIVVSLPEQQLPEQQLAVLTKGFIAVLENFTKIMEKVYG